MVLQDDGKTVWVSERLVKNPGDIDLIARFAPVPACDVPAVRAAHDEIGDRGIVRGAVPGFMLYGQPGCWQDAAVLFGIEPLIMATYDDPEWVRAFLAILRDRKLAFLSSCAGAPFDVLELGGGDASSTVISPKIFDRFVAPFDVPLIEAAHAAGQRIVYHTCGGMMPFLERLADMGPDAMETFTPPDMGGDTRLAEAKARIGSRVCMIGGFDQGHHFVRCSTAETRQAVRACFDAAGAGGGYILAPSDHFFEAEDELLQGIRRGSAGMRIPLLLTVALVAVSACAPDTLPEVSRPVRDSHRPFVVAPRPPCDPALIAAVENGRTDEIRRLAASGCQATCGAQEYPHVSELRHPPGRSGTGTGPARGRRGSQRAVVAAGRSTSAAGCARGRGVRVPVSPSGRVGSPSAGARRQPECPMVSLRIAPSPVRDRLSDMCISEEGTTPLAAAVWSGNAEIVAMLLDAGADAQAADWLGMTPLDYLHDSSVASVLLPRAFPDEATRRASALRAMEGCKGCWQSPANQTPLGRALSGWSGVRYPDRPPPPPCPPGKVRGCIPPAELDRLVKHVDCQGNRPGFGHPEPRCRPQRSVSAWLESTGLQSHWRQAGELKALLDHGANADARWCVPVTYWSCYVEPVSRCPVAPSTRGMTRLMTAAANGRRRRREDVPAAWCRCHAHRLGRDGPPPTTPRKAGQTAIVRLVLARSKEARPRRRKPGLAELP